MGRRRGNANNITMIYWRDIPAQVTASLDGVTERALLEPRFQHAIDRAAAVADLTETEAYIAQWRKESTPLTTDPKVASAEAAEKLNADYPRERLEQLVAQGGAEADG
ncbi:MAG: virulence factor [Acidimicrobiales bacterium]